MNNKERESKNFKSFVLILTLILVILNVVVSYSAFAQRRMVRDISDDPRAVDFKVGTVTSKGIVPFNSILGLTYYNPGTSKIRNIYWDFNRDGTYEVQGLKASYPVTQAIDQTVEVNYVIEIYNTETGTISNFSRSDSFNISGYNALMTLTFDDGHITDYTSAMQILQDKGVKGTAYIVTNWVDWQPNYMSWGHIHALQDAGWEIGSHGVGSNNFSQCLLLGYPIGSIPCNQIIIHPKLSLLTSEQAEYELRESQIVLRENGFPTNNFAYPHGGWNWITYNLTKKYYDSARITNDTINSLPETIDKYLIQVKGTNDLVKSQTTYTNYIDQTIQNKGWLVLNNHIIAEGNCDLCISPSRLSELIDYAQGNRVKIVTIQEAITGSWKN